jgi:hypothetical protein
MSEARTEARIGDAWLLEVERTQTCCAIHQEASGQRVDSCTDAKVSSHGLRRCKYQRLIRENPEALLL